MAPNHLPVAKPPVGFVLFMAVFSLLQMASAMLVFLVPASVLLGMDGLARHWAEPAVALLPVALVGLLFASGGTGNLLVASPLAALTLLSLRPWEQGMPWIARAARLQTSAAWAVLGISAFAPDALFLPSLWWLHAVAALTWPAALALAVLRPTPQVVVVRRPSAP